MGITTTTCWPCRNVRKASRSTRAHPVGTNAARFHALGARGRPSEGAAAVASDVTIHVGAHAFPLKAIVIPIAEFERLKREGKVSLA
jgi:hypothetical protein